MWIGLWISLGILFLWVVFQQACLFGLNERLETLKHLHLNLDADTERRFGRVGGVEVLRGKLESLKGDIDNRFNAVWEHVNQSVAHVGGIWDSVNAMKKMVDGTVHAVELLDKVNTYDSQQLASVARILDALCDRVATLEKDASDRSKQTSLVYKGLPQDRRMYDVDWDKLNSGYGTGDRFFSKVVTRMDELKTKVSSAGDDHRAAEVLPGSPAATIGSQANNSSALLEKMGPKPADLLRLFNAPPIICAEGAVLVKRKGV